MHIENVGTVTPVVARLRLSSVQFDERGASELDGNRPLVFVPHLIFKTPPDREAMEAFLDAARAQFGYE
jgi:hypothetical protein